MNTMFEDTLELVNERIRTLIEEQFGPLSDDARDKIVKTIIHEGSIYFNMLSKIKLAEKPSEDNNLPMSYFIRLRLFFRYMWNVLKVLFRIDSYEARLLYHKVSKNFVYPSRDIYNLRKFIK